jgi:D-alanyl-D-alanine carboxypeptidase
MNHQTSRRLLITGATVLIGIAAATGLAAAAPAATQAATSHDLQNSLAELVAAGAPGTTILVREEHRTTVVAVGLADTKRKTPMRPNSSFRIGSLTKTYVATVVLQLVEEGRLSLDDSVAHFLPGLIPGGDKPTIRQLLNHTSGLYDFENDPRVLKPYLSGNLAYHWAPRKLVQIAVSHPRLFPPGTRYSYSNTNYLVAGLIVEAVTGSTLDRVLDRRIFTPLRLHHSALQTSPRTTVPEAHGYYLLDKPPATDITGLSPYPWAAGAIVATASDVADFYRALLSGRLLRTTSLHAMETTVSEDNFPTDIKGSRYGLGLERYPTPCGIAWGHSGNFPGYDYYALSSSTGKRQLVLAVNQDPHSLSNRENSLFMRLVIRAYCAR